MFADMIFAWECGHFYSGSCETTSPFIILKGRREEIWDFADKWKAEPDSTKKGLP